MTQLVSKEEGGETVVNNIPNVPFMYQYFDKRWKWKHDGFPPLSATFSRARGKVESPIHGEQFQANRNAMIEDKWCNGEHNNGPCSGRNNEDRQRELNHNEDDLNYEILPRDIFPLGLSPFSRKIFQTQYF